MADESFAARRSYFADTPRPRVDPILCLHKPDPDRRQHWLCRCGLAFAHAGQPHRCGGCGAEWEYRHDDDDDTTLALDVTPPE
ncbi:hypothetical protein EHM76_07050 [bacterium]|nr:MAG: hypothetical protein EHM76_07050 [bacterium]